MREVLERKTVKKYRQLSVDDEKHLAQMVADGWDRETAIRVMQQSETARKRWKANRGKPVSEERAHKLNDLYDRMQAEATAGLTK